MRERSKRRSEPGADPKRKPLYGLPVGLNTINGAGSEDPIASPRLALRISRRWVVVAPMLRVSLPAGSTLETIRGEFSALLTGLLRGGVSMRRIERMPLADVMLLNEANRQQWIQSILDEQVSKSKTVRSIR